MLITLDELKAFLKITDSDNDALLTSNIQQADAFIKEYTGRNIEAKDYNYIVDGKGEQEVVLKDYPVNSFTSYQYNTGTLSTPEWSDYDNDRYGVNSSEGVLRSYFCMNKGIQNNKLVYNAGYETIPDDLKKAAIDISTFYYSGAGKTKGAVTKESLDGASIEYNASQVMPEGIYSVLNKYKAIYV